MNPLAIDLYCGLGGWAEGFLAEGYRVAGFDIERHDYGTGGYPGWLVLQDVRTLHGSQFRDAAVIVASPPCQTYSYMAMPWSRAKKLATEFECSNAAQEQLNALFRACFRIQQEACEAAGRYIPMVVENVRGAQRWVGQAEWHFGSYYLWGDVPALMPITLSGLKLPGNNSPRRWDEREVQRLCDAPTKNNGGSWFYGYRKGQGPRNHGSNSTKRKAASAQIAKIPFPLAQHIADASSRHDRDFSPGSIRDLPEAPQSLCSVDSVEGSVCFHL